MDGRVGMLDGLGAVPSIFRLQIIERLARLPKIAKRMAKMGEILFRHADRAGFILRISGVNHAHRTHCQPADYR